ncbi:MAG: acetylglutamate kinase [Acidobacteriota bacterium]|nr:MAG: acetylglutamate kinase [Acidobacteriota bacterium]
MTDLVHALKGALDYTRLYRGQTFVIKIGGEIVDSQETLDGIAMQAALLESLSIRLVLVHGGGPQATRLSERLGIEPELVGGRRVTSPDVLEVCKMVYAGQINVDILSALRKHGVRGVGLSGIAGGLITARRREEVQMRDDDGRVRRVDFGEVGDVIGVDAGLLDTLLGQHFVPVISSLAADDDGRPLNINADTLAVSLATSIGAAKLLVLTSVPGILRDANDSASIVAYADPDDLAEMLESGAIRGGMRPKVEACVRAVRGGVRRTHIIDGRAADALLVELFTGAGCGTMIVGRREKRDYRDHELTEE